jgi:hypothetical protein
MTRQQAEQFIKIYNALLTISTKGEDTKTMSDVLKAMENLANTIQVADPAVETPVEEKTEGE